MLPGLGLKRIETSTWRSPLRDGLFIG